MIVYPVYLFDDQWPFCLVAMATLNFMVTESSYRVIMGKGLNFIFSITSEVMCTIFGIYDHLMIVYPVYVFYDQWPFCLVAMTTLI